MSQIIYQGDVGTALGVQVMEGRSPVDLSAATAKQVLFRRPDGVCVAKDGTFAGDGKDGVIQYITEAGFLDSSGIWWMQGRISLPAGTWSTEPVSFTVSAPLCLGMDES